MKKIKFIVMLLVVIMTMMCFTACGSVLNFNDFASNAKDNAQQMADEMMNQLDKWQGMEEGIEDYLNPDNKPENTVGPYKVIRVVDGDTMMVDIDGVETKVRLIGVDTPESVATGDNAYKNCEEGKTASNFTKSLVEGKYIYIEYDVDPDDNFGRTLAYVYMEDGKMLNKILLEKGYARMMTIQPNVKYVDDFVAIQREAQANGVGFWSDFEQWED